MFGDAMTDSEPPAAAPAFGGDPILDDAQKRPHRTPRLSLCALLWQF
jgi:hypothetical protein